ncbi:type II toxin-antitoxin system PemK/MazF family toxin [Euhalothece natronophila Z-M001]|uniref:Type II toxin-antitoxin system PemK/MazF family toxin n=1 Tax=Euhalothece natronophila Z-M001 TaxID=522448 RepID=A0A5B8NLD7_9CHRO|nr:type II toxin-antitoxin system PemK/MazF family toxin [Euhalothece natronophila]QDZ39808.1 type II toxin-antitoxin system PemK/MazF family toxin [Euhalothece natronophila Z-M001]
MSEQVLQGEVYLFKAVSSSGESKKRPWVIVSENIRNQYSSTVLAVPFTSEANRVPPTRVRVPKGEGGLAVDSIAMCDRITTLKKTLLARGPYGGVIASDYLFQIQEAVLIALGRYK